MASGTYGPQCLQAPNSEKKHSASMQLCPITKLTVSPALHLKIVLNVSF